MPRRSRTRNAEKMENKEQWVVDIETKYGSYDPREYDEKKRRKSIYKWPNDLVAASSLSRYRSPRMVSLGPYHHGEEHLQPMERHKERALHRILRRSKIPLTSFIQSLQDVEQELKDSYDNLDPKLSPHLFIRMMLFDGCFLLEVLRFLFNCHEPFFAIDQSSLIPAISSDSLILENQIPFLVLLKLLEVEQGNNVNNHDYLHRLVANFYGFGFPSHGPCLHMLDIYRECLIANHAQVVEETPISVCSHFQPWLHLTGKGLKRMLVAIPILVFWLLHGRIPKHGHYRTATRLHEAGIKFKEGKPGTGLTITFDRKNGILTLPRLVFSDMYPVFYMNLMAFERMHPPYVQNLKVTEYIEFMNGSIDTAEDVSVLCSVGIMKNFLGSDEDAAKLFNAFADGLLSYEVNSTLSTRRQSQHYAASDWNLAIGHLNRYYFQNPWSVVSLLAAIIFLLLTIIQTVFSGMQTLKDGK